MPDPTHPSTSPSPDEDPLAWLELEMQEAGGSRTEFHHQLEACRVKLVELAAQVQAHIVPTTEAFLDADVASASDHQAIARTISEGCTALEDACFLLLARQSPVAGDLRRIVATIRCVTPIERTAQLIGHIARSLTWVHPPSMPERLCQTLRDLAEQSSRVFAGAVAAWEQLDGLAAVELERTDDEVDLLHKLLLTDLYTGAQSTEESVSLALIARYFERIGDHGVDMARQVTYAVTGERIVDEDRSSD
ncbi:MAG: phosphate uptake regulator PhoU [Nitriliruptoraceae bacterium]